MDTTLDMRSNPPIDEVAPVNLREATQQAAANAPEAGSHLDRLRARRAALLGEHRKILPIPGYHGELFGEFRPLDFDENNAIAKRIQADKMVAEDRRTFIGSMDTLIAACTRILIPDPNNYDGENPGKVDVSNGAGLVPIDPTVPEAAPVRFDNRLCPLLGIAYDDDRGGRGIVLDVFGGKDGEMPMLRYATRIGMWMGDVTGEANENILGE